MMRQLSDALRFCVLVAMGGCSECGSLIDGSGLPRANENLTPDPPSLDLEDAGAGIERGQYDYALVDARDHSADEVAAVQYLSSVEFEPGGEFALMLEGSHGSIYVYEWATGTSHRINTNPEMGTRYLHDLAFDPGTGDAYVVGYDTYPAKQGVILRVDRGTLTNGNYNDAVQPMTAMRGGVEFRSITFDPTTLLPTILWSRALDSGWNSGLLTYSIQSDALSDLSDGLTTTAGCQDSAHVTDEFGEMSVLVACGQDSGELAFWNGAWSTDFPPMGNLSSLVAHPSSDYALVVSWSGGDLIRFDAGNATTIELPLAPYAIAFHPNGDRALITGRAEDGTGTILEYRDGYDTTRDVTDVSISGFGQLPYSATNNTYLRATAFHPQCDGGLIVGGEEFGAGIVVEFQMTNGIACR